LSGSKQSSSPQGDTNLSAIRKFTQEKLLKDQGSPSKKIKV
jgi:hypothetical protein